MMMSEQGTALPWKVTCQLACYAMWSGAPLDQLLHNAYMQRMQAILAKLPAPVKPKEYRKAKRRHMK
jgi:hypothetical protein